MNTQDAIELLGIVPEDDEREIKRKYHKMISRFHPDSLNEVGEAHIQRAQEINEAYRILSQSDIERACRPAVQGGHRDQLLLDELGRAHVLYRAGEGIGGKSRRRDA